MDVSASTLWWVLAGLLVAAELATGTFYLLMFALGLAGAAVTAHLGGGLSAQIITAAVLGGGSTAIWHWRRFRHPQSAPIAENPDAHLDLGARMDVSAWAADRRTQVHYRGSQWHARLADGAPSQAGTHQVVAIEGNELVLRPVLPPAPSPSPSPSVH